MATTDPTAVEPAPEAEAVSDDRYPPWLEALQADTPPEETHKRSLTNRAGQPIMKDGKQVELSYSHCSHHSRR